MSNLLEKETFRLGLIIADTPIDTVVAEYGDYTKIFSQFLQEGLVNLKSQIIKNAPKLEVVSYNAVGEGRKLPNIENKELIDGYLITGSSYNAYDNINWINELVGFVQKLLETKDSPRVVGICFGHQIIGRALNPESVVKNPLGWEVGPLDFKLTSVGKKLFEFDTDTLTIQQMHRFQTHNLHQLLLMAFTLKDHVVELPPGYENLGYNSISHIQGMYKENKVLSVQGHPEFHQGIVSKVAIRRFETGLFPKDHYEEIKSRLENSHDGSKIAVTIWKFFFSLIPSM